MCKSIENNHRCLFVCLFQFYPATIVQIHPPTCTVLFRDYNNYDQVHFSDLKVLSDVNQNLVSLEFHKTKILFLVSIRHSSAR